MTYGIDGSAYLNGTAVYVATPAQAKFFRATASDQPPAPEPDPFAEIAAKVEKLQKLMDAGKAPVEQPAPRPVATHPFRLNRALRRAAAARGRNRS